VQVKLGKKNPDPKFGKDPTTWMHPLLKTDIVTSGFGLRFKVIRTLEMLLVNLEKDMN
jgi:hypothetical protein